MPFNEQTIRVTSSAVLIFFVFSQLLMVSSILLIPKPAEALIGGITLGDIPRYIEKYGVKILQGVALRIAEKFINRFVAKLIDKYKVRNFLYYDQVLSNYYLSNLIADRIGDPDLRQIYSLMHRNYITGQNTGLEGQLAANQALMPRLKQKIYEQYLESGGIPSELIFNPPRTMSNIDYYAAAEAYWLNPPSFTEQNLRGQFGAFQSSATTAAQLEIIVGNGLKAGRIIGGTCKPAAGGISVPAPAPTSFNSRGFLERLGLVAVAHAAEEEDPILLPTRPVPGYDPTKITTVPGLDPASTPSSCEASGGTWEASAVDRARAFIDNPTTFVKSNLDAFVKTHIDTNYNPNNFWVTIGSLLGSFLWNQFGLDRPGNVLFEYPDTYAPEGFIELDIDGDQIPDGYDLDEDGNLDTCHHGLIDPEGEASNDNCQPSSTASNSPYFLRLCQSLENTVAALNTYLSFLERNEFNKRAANTWLSRTTAAHGAVEDLSRTLEQFAIPSYDNATATLSAYMKLTNRVVESLVKDGDLDFGFMSTDNRVHNALISNSINLIAYLEEFRVAIGQCDNPDPDAGNILPPEIIVIDEPEGGGGGTGACRDTGGTVSNYAGALQAGIDAVNAANEGGIADALNTWENSLIYLNLVASRIRNDSGLNATTNVLNGNDNANAGDLIAIWDHADPVVERYDAIQGGGAEPGSERSMPLRQAAHAGGFTGDIPLTCVN